MALAVLLLLGSRPWAGGGVNLSEVVVLLRRSCLFWVSRCGLGGVLYWGTPGFRYWIWGIARGLC